MKILRKDYNSKMREHCNSNIRKYYNYYSNIRKYYNSNIWK